MFRIILLFTLILSSFELLSQEFVLSGYIYDDETGEPLIGASVFDAGLETGTTTNKSGFFSFPLRGGYRVITFAFDGYADKIDSVYLGENVEMSVRLVPYDKMDEITITNLPEGGINLPYMSSSFGTRQVRYMPAVFGEVDLLKSVQFLPGIQPGIEGSNGLYVRGGTPDQNLVLLDGMPVYNVNHVFSFFSSFNPEAISGFQLYKGGYPARFGSRLSSVLDISMKEGNRENFSGSAGISLVSMFAFLEGPLFNGKTSLNVSLRRSWPGIINVINPLVTGDPSETSGAFFYDVNVKVTQVLTKKDKLHVSFYNGRDKFYSTISETSGSGPTRTEEKYDAQLYWTNTTGSVRWTHQASARKFAEYSVGYTRYQLNLSEEYSRRTFSDTSSIFLHYYSGIQDFIAKADYEYKHSYKHQLKYGAIYTLHTFAPGAIQGKYHTPGFALDTLLGPAKRTIGHEAAVYLEDDIHWNQRLRTNIGLRLSAYSSGGTTYAMPEPRFSARYLMNSGWAMKASYTLMNQYIHLLSNSGVGFPVDLWVPSTPKVKPERAQQFTLGFIKTMNETWEMSVEGFYKLLQNTLDYSEGLSFISAQNDWENRVQMGRGKVYGGEVMLQKKFGEVVGMISYTLSWNKRQFDEINGGKEYFFRYDRRHYVTLTSNLQMNEANILGMNVVFGTGTPVTFPFGRYLDADGNVVFDYIEKNSYRLRNYFRIDISYTNIRDRWDLGIEQEFTISVYNVFNRFNPYYMYLSADSTGKPVAKEISLLPFFPSFAYNLRF